MSNPAEAPDSQHPSHGDLLKGNSVDIAPSRRIHPADVAVAAAIPAVLVAIFLLPLEVRRDLALLYTEPSALTMYASHFVHLELPHQTANLLVYLLVVPFSLAVSVWSGRRRRFYAVALVVLTVFPLVLSGLNVLLPRPRIGMGFSGLNLAFVGYLPHALADRFEAERPEWERSRAALLALLFFVGTAIVTVRVTASIYDTTQPGLHWLLVAGAGSLAAAVGLTRPLVSCLRSQGVTGAPIPPLVALGSLLFALLILVGFPDVSPADGSVVNIFLHLLGFSFGYIVPYVAFRVFGLSLGGRSEAVRA